MYHTYNILYIYILYKILYNIIYYIYIFHSGSKSQSKLLLAAGLLDSTIKVFFDDSLKFFLSLYGHKLPVTTIDISTDSTLLASGSADKTIKLWGLDFGM